MSTLTSLPDTKASRVAEHVDGMSGETAGRLHAAASSIRRGGRQGSKAIEDLAESAATTLDEADSYVKKHSVKRTIGESREMVRRYPGRSLAIAAGVGCLTGFAFRRLTHTCDNSVADH